MLRFSRELYNILESLKEIEQEEAGDEATQIAFDYVFNQLKLKTQGYAVTDVKNLVNKQLRGKDIEINNRQVKGELIRRYGTNICFSYPSNKSLSQMFFSSSLKVIDVAETVRITDTIAGCATDLRNECKHYDFGLETSYRDADNITYEKARKRSNRTDLLSGSSSLSVFLVNLRYLRIMK